MADRPHPGLKYEPVEQLDRTKVTFDNFAVEDPNGEHLGKMEGIILDVSNAVPVYVVVNAGGWFRTKHFLIPIGHAALDSESRKLIADVPKARVKRFPGFDLDLFPKLTQDDFDRMADEIARVCCPDLAIDPSAAVARVEIWAHYRTPAWWDRDFYRPDPVEEESRRSR
jgi:hypothetical protein